jgi:hypothetical protein
MPDNPTAHGMSLSKATAMCDRQAEERSKPQVAMSISPVTLTTAMPCSQRQPKRS